MHILICEVGMKFKKDYTIICITNFFKKTVITISVILFVLIINLIFNNFIDTVRECLGNFVQNFNNVIFKL